MDQTLEQTYQLDLSADGGIENPDPTILMRVQ